MSAGLDLYAPWREPTDALRARNVGREDLLRAVLGTVDAFLAGQRPVHLYLFGPRGAGKSHVLALAWGQIREKVGKAGAHCVTVSEDIPELGTAAALLARVEESLAGPAWLRWGTQVERVKPVQSPRVILFEGLDRQLNGLPELERRRFRSSIEEGGLTLVIGTGVGLSEPFTGKDTAFYGAFAPYPVKPLTRAEAELLLERVSPQASGCESATSTGRRKALAALAGGSPRALVALGLACSGAPETWVSDNLASVVKDFTAHYQLRFRDLAPQQQQVMEVLALAPRELSPTEIGESLRISASHASGIANRLVEAGAAMVRSDGRHSWFSAAEPLFRFWMEYRTAPWDQTRVALLGRLLESLLAPAELLVLWMDNPDPEIQGAVEDALKKNPARNRQLWLRLVNEFARALSDSAAAETSNARVLEILNKAKRTPPPADLLVRLARHLTYPHRELRPHLRDSLLKAGLNVVTLAWAFEDELHLGQPAREAFSRFLKLTDQKQTRPAPRAAWSLAWTVMRRAVGIDGPAGRSWRLTRDELSQLARMPVLRGVFLGQGKRASHPPLLSCDDLLLMGITQLDVDWDVLFAAATRHAHPGLFGVLLHHARTGPIRPYLPICPTPQRLAPCEPDRLAELLLDVLAADPRSTPEALTWVASLSSCSQDLWAGFIACVREGTSVLTSSPPTGLISTLQIAFAALGIRASDRLTQLIEVLPSGQLIAQAATAALALASQLAEQRTARLYPELAELAALLASSEEASVATPGA